MRAAEFGSRGGAGRSGPWLQLANGQREEVVFVGAAHPRDVCFIDGGYVPCTPTALALGGKRTRRFAFNVVTLRSMQMRVLDHTEQLWGQVKVLGAEYDLDSWSFTVERRDKPYKSYHLSPGSLLTLAELAGIAPLHPYDLAAIYTARPDSARLSTYDTFLALRDIDPFS